MNHRLAPDDDSAEISCLSALDWIIVAAFLAGLAATALRPIDMRTVSGFLAADHAGRYLIAVSYGMAQLGVISLSVLQQYYDVGFTSIWWVS